MSTSPYSLDLREKVIKFLESGGSQRTASKVFRISPTTVNIWHVRYKREGNYNPRKRLGAKPRIKIKDFINYVERYPNLTTSEIGKYFSISDSGARYWLRKLNFTYKKKPIAMWKRILSNVVNI